MDASYEGYLSLALRLIRFSTKFPTTGIIHQLQFMSAFLKIYQSRHLPADWQMEAKIQQLNVRTLKRPLVMSVTPPIAFPGKKSQPTTERYVHWPFIQRVISCSAVATIKQSGYGIHTTALCSAVFQDTAARFIVWRSAPMAKCLPVIVRASNSGNCDDLHTAYLPAKTSNRTGLAQKRLSALCKKKREATTCEGQRKRNQATPSQRIEYTGEIARPLSWRNSYQQR